MRDAAAGESPIGRRATIDDEGPGLPGPGVGELARKKTTKSLVNAKASLSRRLAEVRRELFGEHGGPELARRLGLPARTWYNYETGVTVPAEVLLRFIEQTGADPDWLLDGAGPKYRRSGPDLAALSPVELIRRGLEKLEEQSGGVVIAAPEDLPGEAVPEFAAVALVPMGALARTPIGPRAADGHIVARRDWLPNPSRTVGVRLADDAMDPILPSGSLAAIDLTVTDPRRLEGRIVAARVEGAAVIRWLEFASRHLILRPNLSGREHPPIPIELGDGDHDGLIIGQVIWWWVRFGGA